MQRCFHCRLRMAESNAPSRLDHSLCQQLEKHIEELTTSGQLQLDGAILKKLKHICKRSDGYVTHAFHVSMIQLNKEHAEIRSATCQLIDELFSRSHCFRELLLDVFQQFIDLTLETDPNNPLPPPRPVARKMIASVQDMVCRWNRKFGAAYRKLALGYDFLLNCKKKLCNQSHKHVRLMIDTRHGVVSFDWQMSFGESSGQTVAERELRMEREKRQEALRQEKLNSVLLEMNDVCVEIDSCLKEIDSCLQLLLPTPDNFNPAINDPSITQTDSCPSNHSPSTIPELTPKSPETKSLGQSDISEEQNYESFNSDCQKHDSGFESNQSQPVPSTSHQSSDEDNGDASEDNEDDLRQHGVTDWKYSLQISVNSNSGVRVTESEDNADILKALWDMMRLVRRKFQPTISKWLEALTKNSADGTHIKKVLDMRRAVNTAIQKVEKLNVIHHDGTRNTGIDDTDSDSDFEDVAKKDGYEEGVIAPHGSRRPKLAARTSDEWQLSGCGVLGGSVEYDPTSLSANIPNQSHSHPAQSVTKQKITNRPSASATSSSDLHSRAPVVPYSTDLLHWGEKLETPMRVKFDVDHRFWNAQESEETVDKSALEALTTRRITFAGNFECVKWQCRAPLNDTGKLCERMDRVKCPFHGKVIGRDKFGQPTNEEDRTKLAIMEAQNEGGRSQDWDDVELQRDIEAATGVSLVRKGRGKGRGKEHSNLTNLRKQANTSRNRLEAKVFKRKTMKRVADTLNSIDSKRFKDKFGNSFNYAYDN